MPITLMAPDAVHPAMRRGVRGLPVRTRGLGGATEDVLASGNSELTALRAEVRRRIAGGSLYRLDGKPGCDAGPWGNNYRRMQTWEGDPVWCLRDRDRTLPPVLRFDIPCDRVPELFWPDIYERAQNALRAMLAGEPRAGAPWRAQFDWTRRTLELVSIALEATNIQPLFLFPAQWAETQVFKALAGDGSIQNWGLYSSSFTRNGETRPTTHSGGYMTPRYGAGLPSEILQYDRERVHAIARAEGRTPADVIPLSGVHYSRESTGLVKEPTLGVAAMVGCNLTTNSQFIRAMREGQHDPWAPTWGDSSGPSNLTNGIAAKRGARPGDSQGAWKAASEWYVSRPWADFFSDLFETTASKPSGMEPTYSGVTNTRGWIPNGQWWVGFAARWARAIVARSYSDIFFASLQFYLVNHTAYFERLLGPTAPMTTREASQVLDQLRYMKSQMPAMGHAMGASLIRTAVGGGVVGAVTSIVADVAKGVQDEASRLYHFPELPKPLFKRIPRDATCGGEGGSTAVERTVPFLFPAQQQQQTQDDGGSESSKLTKPLLIGGALVAAGAAAYFLLKD